MHTESSIVSDFALIADNIVAAMPRQEGPAAAKEQPEGGSQASMQGSSWRCTVGSAASPGKEREDDAVAAANKAAQYAVVVAVATAKKAA